MHVRTCLLTLTFCALPSLARAQEYCVTCTQPDAKYRCVIGGEPAAAVQSSRAQLLCITELARTGPHASCSVGRTTTAPCEGELRTLIFPSGPDLAEPPLPPGPDLNAGGSPAGPDIQGAPPPDRGHPETLQDGANESGGAAGDEGQSGNAVGKALQKSWECLSSLFSKC
jgi:hypothetical protein